MSILSTVNTLITKTKDVLGIETPKADNTSANAGTKELLYQYETEAPIDSIKMQTNKDETSKESEGMSAKEVENTLSKTPTKKLNINKMIKKEVIKAVTGLSEEEFKKLPIKEKRVLLDAIKRAIATFDKLFEEGKIDESGDPELLAIEFGKILFDAVSSGIYENIDDLINEVGNPFEELGGDNYRNIGAREQREKAKKYREKELNELNQELNSVQDLPENERSSEENRIRRRHGYRSKARYNMVSAQMDSRSAANALVIGGSDNMAANSQMLIQTRSSAEERTATADYADYDYTTNLINDFNELGEEVQASVLEDYTQTVMEYKSSSAAYKYQESYKADRDKFEKALQKQKNGEPLTAEEKALLATMKQEYYTATAKGIGQGILYNTNMTTDEKADFISKWESYAKKYSDYKEVVEDVKRELASNPEYSDINSKIEKNNSEKEAVKTNSSNNDNNITSNNANTSVKVSSTTQQLNYVTKPENKNTKASSANNSNTQTSAANKRNRQELAQSISDIGLNKTIEKYGKDSIELILNDNAFRHLRPQLKIIIKSADLNTLKSLSVKGSDNAFLFIYNSVEGEEKKKALLDFREKNKSLCFTTKNVIEKEDNLVA